MHAIAPLSLYSVVIPARDEEESLPSTIADIVSTFEAAHVPHEIVVVDDGSKDDRRHVARPAGTERKISYPRTYAQYRRKWFRPRHYLGPGPQSR
jgi:glycosyltransferase involved in cell wall biosynthesis